MKTMRGSFPWCVEISVNRAQSGRRCIPRGLDSSRTVEQLIHSRRPLGLNIQENPPASNHVADVRHDATRALSWKLVRENVELVNLRRFSKQVASLCFFHQGRRHLGRIAEATKVPYPVPWRRTDPPKKEKRKHMAIDRLRAVFMRGGTYKAVMFRRDDLPENPRDLGPHFPASDRLARSRRPPTRRHGRWNFLLIEDLHRRRSTRPDADIDYTFAQIESATASSIMAPIAATCPRLWGPSPSTKDRLLLPAAAKLQFVFTTRIPRRSSSHVSRLSAVHWPPPAISK